MVPEKGAFIALLSTLSGGSSPANEHSQLCLCYLQESPESRAKSSRFHLSEVE